MDPIEEERRRLRRVRTITDLTAHVLAQGDLSHPEAERLVAGARRQILELCPGKESVFDLVLAPRFARLIAEYVKAPSYAARVLPFREPSSRTRRQP